jgi:hypothetical protein
MFPRTKAEGQFFVTESSLSRVMLGKDGKMVQIYTSLFRPFSKRMERLVGYFTFSCSQLKISLPIIPRLLSPLLHRQWFIARPIKSPWRLRNTC